MYAIISRIEDTDLSIPMGHYKIEAGTGQHIGDRPEQQDRVALFVSPRAPGYMMAVVADGMGGVTGGRLAAEQVISSAKQAFEMFSPQTDRIETLLETMVRDAHTIIRLTAISSDKKPHSTAVALVLTPERSAIWIHIGDSRLYRFTGTTLAERTTDHSYAEQLVQEGKLSPNAARGSQLTNVLVNVLGADYIEPQVVMRHHDDLKAGDAFILCSDGLWHYFSDAELGQAVASHSPRQASELLINTARERAAGTLADNCTLAIVKLVEAPEEASPAPARKARRPA